MNHTILVVGATGMLGEPVARQLAQDGYTIRVLARSPEKAAAQLSPGFEIVPGDVEKPETLLDVLAGCQGVHINLAGGPTKESYLRIEYEGTANVVRAAAATGGIERISYLSGASLRWQDKDFIPTQAKLRAEQAIQESGLAYTIFRPSWFMESLPLFVQGKQAYVIGKQPNPVHWIAAQDYARMVSAAYQNPAAAHKILTVYGPEAIRMLPALKRYCEIVQPEVTATTMPLWLTRLLAKLSRNIELKDVADLMAYYRKHPRKRGCQRNQSTFGSAGNNA